MNMPLVTRQANQGNLFVQATEPAGWKDGDVWVDTDNSIMYVNDDGTAVRQASFTDVLVFGSS